MWAVYNQATAGFCAVELQALSVQLYMMYYIIDYLMDYMHVAT